MASSDRPATGREGLVVEIQRLSTEDGPGIRTTVFLKGCSLACIWCHNPEGILPRPELQWIGSRCIGCGTCLECCPDGALRRAGGRIAIDRRACTGCGLCAERCPATALEVLGRPWDADALVRELVKDRAYFDKSGGGVTLSGGDPAAQPDFSCHVLGRLRESGIRTAIDTCGQCGKAALEQQLALADLVLYDLKEIDPDRHRSLTGHANGTILENAVRAADYMARRGGALWLRTPVIPGATDREETIAGIGAFIARHLAGRVQVWELCAFNNLCRDKYVRLGRDWPFKDSPLLSTSVMERLAAVARNSGVDPQIVRWSGATRLEDSGDVKEVAEQR
jgi:pyruvate formate lyase activating enzyme